MHVKLIYWRHDLDLVDGKMTANIHYLIGYAPTTITQFQTMSAEIRKTFPEATDDKVECGKVFRSQSVDGFTIATITLRLKKKKFKGWTPVDVGLDPPRYVEYSW